MLISTLIAVTVGTYQMIKNPCIANLWLSLQYFNINVCIKPECAWAINSTNTEDTVLSIE